MRLLVGSFVITCDPPVGLSIACEATDFLLARVAAVTGAVNSGNLKLFALKGPGWSIETFATACAWLAFSCLLRLIPLSPSECHQSAVPFASNMSQAKS